MSSNTAVISNIQGYSIHDGPGIRTVVFFKGCPLRCKWCANPEGLSAEVQVGFIKKLCTRCGRCFEACPVDAIIQEKDEYRINRNSCNGCADCVKACYYGALVKYGEEYTVDEVYDQVRRDKMFYDSSGGGVTVSGGEPLLYADFIFELFSLCKGEGINTCIETSGKVPEESIEKVFTCTDFFMFDLKHMDSKKHKEYTGVHNELILRNAEFLAKHHKNLLFRQPVIPGVNDNDTNIRETADFIKQLGSYKNGIQLMPFHRMGQTKYEALQIESMLDNMEIMPEDVIEGIKEKYIKLGVKCTISK